jgi:hypothetical protein
LLLLRLLNLNLTDLMMMLLDVFIVLVCNDAKATLISCNNKRCLGGSCCAGRSGNNTENNSRGVAVVGGVGGSVAAALDGTLDEEVAQVLGVAGGLSQARTCVVQVNTSALVAFLAAVEGACVEGVIDANEGGVAAVALDSCEAEGGRGVVVGENDGVVVWEVSDRDSDWWLCCSTKSRNGVAVGGEILGLFIRHFKK